MHRLFKLVLMAVLFANCVCNAQNKIVEKSEAKAPKWIKEFNGGFIVGSAIGTTMDEARDKAFLQIKQEIANSIAVNIQASSVLSQQEERTATTGNISESMQSEIKTKTANIPALKGISISKAADVFWQKEVDKAHVAYYRYFIRYPLAQSDLFLLVQEYNEMEERMNHQLDSIVNCSASNINSTDDIDRMVVKADELILYFTDNRKEKAVAAKNELLNLYSKIDLHIDENKRNQLKYRLFLFDKEIETSVKPTFRSNCCSDFNYANHQLTYRSDDCYDTDKNSIEIFYAFMGYRLYKKVIIN